MIVEANFLLPSVTKQPLITREIKIDTRVLKKYKGKIERDLYIRRVIANFIADEMEISYKEVG